jgi:hypothetical protein
LYITSTKFTGDKKEVKHTLIQDSMTIKEKVAGTLQPRKN